jgi:hypothetical protein
MLGSLITAPLRLGLRATALVLDEAINLTQRALGLLGHDEVRANSATQAPDGATQAPDSAPVVDIVRAAPVVDTVAPAPSEPPAPAHVSAEPELVAETADPGALDGAGAQVRVAEPWDGYRSMKAADIVDRLATGSREELAAVELYELAGRRRKSVLAAAERALKQASPPRPEPS